MRLSCTIMMFFVVMLCANAQEENDKLTISGHLTYIDSK